MNSGETSYVWQLGLVTDINVYRCSGSAQNFFCKLNVIASPTGIVTDLSTTLADSWRRGIPKSVFL